MRLLDLFCGAGGCAVGYYRAGFHDITGIDINPQPNYPYAFVQADALEYLAEHGSEFDFIHASPPCQFYSEATPADRRALHPDLIKKTRMGLREVGKPYVIENVEGAKSELVNPLMLCGTMFGLCIWRHRFFEIWPEIFSLLSPCAHYGRPVLITGQPGPRKDGSREKMHDIRTKRRAIGIDWMSRPELSQAIPPAYTQWIGERLLESMAVTP